MTEYLSIYGATLSTIIGLAGLYKWWTDSPKLKIDLKVNMIEKDEHLQRSFSKENPTPMLMSISIANTGKWPTTIRFLALQPYRKTFPKIRSESQDACLLKTEDNKYFTAKLPYVLKPGEEWSGVCSQPVMAAEYDWYLEIDHSHKKTPTKVKVNLNPVLTSVASYFRS